MIKINIGKDQKIVTMCWRCRSLSPEKAEASDAFKLLLNEAENNFGRGAPLVINGWTHNDKGFIADDMIVAPPDTRPCDKTEPKCFYLPSELVPSCSSHDHLHK